MATVQDLINAVNGKRITVTGPDAGECTAIPHYWSNMLGQPIVYGNAKDTFSNAGAGYTRIANGPSNYPAPGSIMVWGSSWGGGYGHTGVVIDANSDSFRTIEQNNPTGSVAHILSHDYSGVIGWFTPNNVGTVPAPTNSGASNMPQVPQEQIDAWLHGPDGIDHWKIEAYNRNVDLTNANNRIAELQGIADTRQTQLDENAKTIADLTGQVQAAKAELATTKDALAKAEAAAAATPVTSVPIDGIQHPAGTGTLPQTNHSTTIDQIQHIITDARTQSFLKDLRDRLTSRKFLAAVGLIIGFLHVGAYDQALIVGLGYMGINVSESVLPTIKK